MMQQTNGENKMTKQPTNVELEFAVEKTADHFQELYLDWFNNFLTLARFAEYYELSIEEANQYINIGRKIHQQRTS
jgi:hypothetical protein